MRSIAAILVLAASQLSVPRAEAQVEDEEVSMMGSGEGDTGDTNPVTPLLLSITALTGLFAIIIVILTVGIVIMCRKQNSKKIHLRSKVNTYRGFSQERTQSPSECTVIRDPLSRPRSHSHIPTSPLSPLPLISASAATRLSSSSSVAAASIHHHHHPNPRHRSASSSATVDTHTYNHLRDHEGMELLPTDYPLHDYSKLGPRLETPPRPPKPAHLRQSPPTQTLVREGGMMGEGGGGGGGGGGENRALAPQSDFIEQRMDLSLGRLTLSNNVSRFSEGDGHRNGHDPQETEHRDVLTREEREAENEDEGRGAGREEERGGGGGGGGEDGESDEVFVHQPNIYNTMASDLASDNELASTTGQIECTNNMATMVDTPTADLDTDDYSYERLVQPTNFIVRQQQQQTKTSAQVTSQPSSSDVAGGSNVNHRQRKSSVKIFDDPTYVPRLQEHTPAPPATTTTTTVSQSNGDRYSNGSNCTTKSSLPAGPGLSVKTRSRSTSVKIVDPRYIGDYERHPDFVPPQIEVSRDRLQEKYRGDYERDPTYFTRNPTRSFSVSAVTGNSVRSGSSPHGPGTRDQRPSLTLEPRRGGGGVPDQYRGDYERSEDYIIPGQTWQVATEATRLDTRNGTTINGQEATNNSANDYVLETDPNYTGAYERHPDYVPPLVRRSSKTKIQILSVDTPSASSSVSSSTSNGGYLIVAERSNHIPHEYTSLAAVTKDPPREYATLNSDLSTTRTLPTASVKNSMV